MKALRMPDEPESPAILKYPSTLRSRYEVLQREMLGQLERTIIKENYWLAFVLLGWEHLATCMASHWLVEVMKLQVPYRWPYAMLWAIQALLVPFTIRLVGRRTPGEISPLEPKVSRIWQVFMVLACSVVGLNAAARLPVFTLLPVWAMLSSFSFLVMATFLTQRFMVPVFVMLSASLLMGQFPRAAFLIYGVAWLLVLEGLGVYFWWRGRSRIAETE